ncbi:MAG TPA: hypothetical protein VMC10_01135 [Stellaceae bacterium]|nr:hypothetical protein [Stellaceae bacterium]
MADFIEHLACALIEAHGDDAVSFAEQALHNVRSRGLADRVAEWERVIETVRRMQSGG